MHVLITANSGWNLANFRAGLIDALLADGHRVTALAPADEHMLRLKARGCVVLPLEMDVKGMSPPRDIALALRFFRHFGKLRPDVILSFTIKNNIFGALAARALRIPFFPTVTGLGTAFLSGPLLRRLVETLYRAAFRHATAVFFHNADDLALFLERGLVAQDKTRLVAGSGIDLERFEASEIADSGPAPTFLLIGRILRDKGVVEYIEAARMVRQRYPQARFLLLGQVGAENRGAIARESVNNWQREGLISHLEHAVDVRTVIEKADCVVLPSYREGAPRTLIEAAAMTRPLVASDVPGCRAVVEHGVTGLLCEPRSSTSLRDAMITFIELAHSRRIQMGRAGRSKMEREFDQRDVFEAYRQAIGRVSAKGQAGRRMVGSSTPVQDRS